MSPAPVTQPKNSPAAPEGKRPYVEFRNIGVRFGTTTALCNVNVTVTEKPEDGEFVTIIGPSGCGKSTLLNLLAGLLAPTEGEILVGGKKIEGPGRDRGMIFQQYSSFPHLTVKKNVLFGLKMNNDEFHLSRSERDERAMELIAVSAWWGTRINTLTSFRAASSSAWRSPARWRWSHGFC